MNIFYDDLFCQESTDDIAFLQGKGFVIEPTSEPKIMTMDEIYANVYAYLDDYKNAGFKFITFPDELLRFRHTTQSFLCFGRDRGGYFVLNQDEQIYYIVGRYNSIDTTKDDWFSPENDIPEFAVLNKHQQWAENGVFIRYVNKNLLDFLHCYHFFLASLYHIKAHLTSILNPLGDIINTQADVLKQHLANIDPLAINDWAFWGDKILEMQEGEMQLLPMFAPYMTSGRMWSVQD